MDRPLECSSCQELCAVVYKQLSSTRMTEETMCRQCPVLKQRLQGKQNESLDKNHAEVACNFCQTSLHDILRHDALGCVHCYEVFEQAICQRLNIEKLDYKQDVMTNFNSSPHTEHLMKLTQELQEAVSSENFEKAALIRDEINKMKQTLTEN